MKEFSPYWFSPQIIKSGQRRRNALLYVCKVDTEITAKHWGTIN